MSAHTEDTVGTAALAKAALRYLAERRMLPTPENFENAWCTVGGELNNKARATPVAPAARAAVVDDQSRVFVESMIRQLQEHRVLAADQATELRAMVRASRWTEASSRIGNLLNHRGTQNWTAMIDELTHGLAVTHRGWTQARKRDSLTRLIEGANRRDDILYVRLNSLLDSWKREPLDETPEPVAALPLAPALSQPVESSSTELSAAATPVATEGGELGLILNTPEQLRQQRNERMIAEMSELLATLCENMAGVSQETGWIRGQADVLRQSLQNPDDYRTLSEVRRLIAQSGEAQRKMVATRQAALDEVKQMIASWIESVGVLSSSTGEYGERIGKYAESVGQLDSVESLSSTVSAMLADTKAMAQTIAQSRDEMAATRSRAMMLESDVSRLEDELANASTQVITDHLTNTMNRRGLEQAFAGAQQRAIEWRSKLVLAVLDVDDFKRVNDSLGHKGGDDALRQLARIFKLKLRATDAVARFGGEEFVMLLPDLDLAEGVEHMTRLQREVTAHVFMSDQKRMFITFSAGVTEVNADDNLMSAIERADQAMYTAKKAGKNCVRFV